MKSVLNVILTILVSQSAIAGVIRVDTDGSGDFTIIQDAMDAVASGDTILIGPGRYNEGSMVTTPGWTEFVRVIVRVNELTIIGAGADQTIIGPSHPYDRSEGVHRGIEFSDYWGAKQLTMQKIGLENMGRALDGDMIDAVGSSLTMIECRVFGSEYGYWGNVEQIDVSECVFSNTAYIGSGIIALGGGSMSISDSDFRSLTPWTGVRHVHIQGPREVTVDRSEFLWGSVGFYVGSGGQAVLRNCSFSSQSDVGVDIGNGEVSIELTDCFFTNQKKWSLNMSSKGITLKIDRMTVTDAVEGTVRFSSPVNGYIRDSLLAKGSQYVVVADTPIYDPENPIGFHFDMTNNWWGTDDPDSIQAWIFDAVADTQSSTVVEWEPYKGEAVATEKQSLGSLKSTFR